MPASADLLRDLRAFCAQGLAAPADDASFGALALRLFAAQYDGLPSYRAYCQRRGALPTRLRHWSEIPAVPVQAFRDVRLWWDEDGPPAAVFRTSGTTSAGARPGEHYMSAGGLALYEASLLPAFRAYVLPELSPGARSPLVPYVLGPFAEYSSLGHMIDVVVRDCFDAPPRGLDALGPLACIFATDLALEA